MSRTTLFFVGLLGSCQLLAASQVDQVQLPPDREFFFQEIEDRKAGPNAFLQAHANRQALPGQVDETFRAKAAGKAWAAQQGLARSAAAKKSGSNSASLDANGAVGVWRTVGPYVERSPAPFEPSTTSGRVTAMAIQPGCSEAQCVLYVGTAGGGLWKSRRALDPLNPRWKRLTNGLLSNNIGSVHQDPNDRGGRTIYVGTGESNFTFTSMAGKGLFKSSNGGKSFTRIPTMITDTELSPEPLDFTATRGISQVAVKPGDPETIYLATTVASQGMTAVRGGQSTLTGGPQAKIGLYRTTDGGENWSRLFTVRENRKSSQDTHDGAYERISGVKDVRIDPLDPTTVWISVADDGLYRSAPALEGGDETFKKVFGIVGNDTESSYASIDLTVQFGDTRVYLYNGTGKDLDAQGMYRLDFASVPASELFDGTTNTSEWREMTIINTPHSAMDWGICGGQCVYDLVVASPDGEPNTVVVGGQFTRYTWDAVIRSTDAGHNFSSLAIDAQSPPSALHVDVRAIVFSPDDPDIVFVGSDGGVARTNGQYGDASDLCGVDIFQPGSGNEWACKAGWQHVPEKFIFMNRGLQTMQLFNISAASNRPLQNVMAGTQDNSTQWNVGTGNRKNWTKIFPIGDGTSANGFHAENPEIIFASFQSSHFFTNFTSRPARRNWLYTGGPMSFSEERLYPNSEPGSGRQFITFDPHVADRQFTAYEHVWRTNNNGGDQATLKANGCASNGDWFQEVCGDWEPLGEFLTRAGFGPSREGGVIVAAERSKADAGTLWAGTSLGRVFVTQNSHAPAGEVTFERLDKLDTPPRFVSGIAVDNENPNRAFVSYSGFNGVTPEQPGHVFLVTYDPDAATATFTNIDHNLGDMPVNHIVRDDITGDLYIATDFGVLTLPAGTTQWEPAGEGLPTVLTPHLEMHSEGRKLFAATHGLGGWYLNLAEAGSE